MSPIVMTEHVARVSEVEPDADGTRLSLAIRMEADSPWVRRMLPILLRGARRARFAQLGKLKPLVETDSDAH